ARGLSPITDADGGITDALAHLADDVSEAYGISCSFLADRALEVDGDRAGHVYRIVQEAVSNAARHGRAKSVFIEVHHDDGTAEVHVADDGTGITDAALEGESGLGLRTMRYRARRLGGTLEVEAPDSGGTEVVVRFPLV
ncbi:sensor histidine kinase, partial [Rubrivirga sp.]|uniref:sensor histidine kinase n=1 Tax=Rubrivirga sp. TaxID=1885344 RepID=UPI003C749B54